MTAEIALMNRYAVALAADSAVTTTYWQGGRRQTRYFKGANKIFHISGHHPVGLMIYDAAALQGVPWEIIAKAYRDHRGEYSHPELPDYARDVFDFILSNGHLFPQEHQQKQLVSSITDALNRLCYVIADEQLAATDDNLKGLSIQDRFQNLQTMMAGAPFIGDQDLQEMVVQAGQHQIDVIKAVEDSENFIKARAAVDDAELFKWATLAVFKRGWTTLPTTGLVFAGYGGNQYFPDLQHYTCYGVLLGKVICEEPKRPRVTISHENVSAIEPVAQSEMVKTFMYGVSPTALKKMNGFLDDAINEYERQLVAGGHLNSNVDLTTARTAAEGMFTREASSYLWTGNTQPLRQVVGMLSIPELAELAETLITIESLKERVTKPTESVSGPVDVAVISKSDGFIWIKRKHYFERDLNPRFFSKKTQVG